jgi:hypothetical protein
MAQAVGRRPLTTEARFRSQVKSMWDLWWTKWHWDRFFSELSVFPCQFHSTGAPLLVKLGKKLLIFIFITGVAQKALRLRCVRSICCGAPSKKKKSFRWWKDDRRRCELRALAEGWYRAISLLRTGPDWRICEGPSFHDNVSKMVPPE